MALTDSFGLPITTDSKAARDAWDRTIRAFIAHGAETPVCLGKTLEAAPDFALAHTAKGFFLLLLGRSEMIPPAREACDTAKRIVAECATPRERRYVDALELYLSDDLCGAAQVLDDLLTEFPEDALCMKLVQAIRFVLGDARGMRASLERILPAYKEDTDFAPYVQGCYAFALEETGDYLAAEACGRDAVLRAANDAWGVHAVAHVFDMTNRTREGVAWLAGQPETWAHCNNFRYHVWWHLALFHLDRGDFAEALRLYDAEVRQDPLGRLSRHRECGVLADAAGDRGRECRHTLGRDGGALRSPRR